MAQDALASGTADAVEMTRAQIADPELVSKVRAGVPGTVRPCVLCNQACQVRDPRNPVVSCIGEPSSGHETEDAPVTGATSRPQRVLVVGGGPAGLEAARTAALRGHRVRVVERAVGPGGAVRAAAAGAGRERLAQITDWLASECARLGVELDLGRELGGADIEAHDGTVLICTGSRDGRRDYLVEPPADIRTARSVLERAADGALPGGPCVIWDPVGGPIGISVAELLAADREVALVTHDLIPGTQLARSGDLADASTRLQRAGIAQTVSAGHGDPERGRGGGRIHRGDQGNRGRGGHRRGAPPARGHSVASAPGAAPGWRCGGAANRVRGRAGGPPSRPCA